MHANDCFSSPCCGIPDELNQEAYALQMVIALLCLRPLGHLTCHQLGGFVEAIGAKDANSLIILGNQKQTFDSNERLISQHVQDILMVYI